MNSFSSLSFNISLACNIVFRELNVAASTTPVDPIASNAAQCSTNVRGDQGRPMMLECVNGANALAMRTNVATTH